MKNLENIVFWENNVYEVIGSEFVEGKLKHGYDDEHFIILKNLKTLEIIKVNAGFNPFSTHSYSADAETIKGLDYQIQDLQKQIKSLLHKKENFINLYEDAINK